MFIFVLSFFKGMNKVIDSELLEYSVHAGVQTTLQVCSHTQKLPNFHNLGVIS